MFPVEFIYLFLLFSSFAYAASILVRCSIVGNFSTKDSLSFAAYGQFLDQHSTFVNNANLYGGAHCLVLTQVCQRQNDIGTTVSAPFTVV